MVEMLMIAGLAVVAVVAFMLYSQWNKFREFRSKLMYALIVSGMSHQQANDFYTGNATAINRMHQNSMGIGGILGALGINRSMHDEMERLASTQGYSETYEPKAVEPKAPKSTAAFDSLIHALYGDNPPPRSAILSDSIQIAHDDLLLSVIPLKEITEVAKTQFESGIPYSTYDLAFSTALYFFREHPAKQDLFTAQLASIGILGDAVVDGRLNPALAESFQNYTYTAYHPNNQ
jgi:hypothetical protein